VLLEVLEIENNRVHYLFNQHRFSARFATWEHAGTKHLSLKNGTHIKHYQLPNPIATELESAGELDAIVAPMTGIIRMVTTEVNSSVKQGESLLVLEAMKMEIQLTAPRDGVVERLLCSVGDAVDDGSVLIELKSD